MRTGLMAAIVGLAGSLAMGSGVSTVSDNAALEYYRAWALMGDTPEELIETGKDEIKLTPQAPGQLARLDDSILILIRASDAGVADWGVDYEDGPNTLLPHLGSLRRSARVMAAAALQHGEHGAPDQAAECLAALHRMGVDSASGDHLISSLVGIAIGNLGVELTNQMIDEGMIDAAGARVVLQAIRGDGLSDRYRMRDAIVGEWRMIAEFLLSRAPEKGAGAWLLETVQIEPDDTHTQRIAEMDRSALMGEMGGWSMFFSDVLAAWDTNDRGELTSVVERLRGDSYGTLAYVIAPSVSRAIESSRQSEKDFDRLIDRLEEIAD
ncbi:MAG: hypothetical protein ACF8MF_08665 [Phycisphaerales bacterium JB052]